MNNNVYSFALKNTLDEIQGVCPDVFHIFIFKDGEILAKGETTDEKAVNRTIDAFDAITERADAIGGLEAVTIQGANGKVNISCINDFYLTTVLSKAADEKYVNTLTRVLIPIVIKLVDNVHPAPANDEAPTVNLEAAEEEATEEEAAEEKEAENAEDYKVEPAQEEIATIEPTAEEQEIQEEEKAEVNNEPLLPEPPVTQLIVENLGGLLVPSDTVRIDKSVITEWNDLYGDKKIEEVDIETLDGKTTRCKFKPIKSSKQEGKGIIQMPEKIQITLEATKGELVMVKPVVE
jgi:hypothetical protein